MYTTDKSKVFVFEERYQRRKVLFFVQLLIYLLVISLSKFLHNTKEIQNNLKRKVEFLNSFILREC